MTKLALLLVFAMTTLAQDVKFYRLDFTLREMEDQRALSVKKFTAFSTTDEKMNGATIRTGTKVPYTVSNNPNNIQFNYVDIGVNIDVPYLREQSGHLVIRIIAEVTSIPASDGPVTSSPIVRQNRWNLTTLIEPLKAATLVSSDDLNSKRRLQLEVVATPVK